MSSVYAATLKRAAQILGGADALARYLEVSTNRVVIWQDGRVLPPYDVFLRAVDVVLTKRD